MIFRNPVADFLGQEVEGQRPSISVPATWGGKAATPDDRGFVDHVEALESSCNELEEILGELAGRTQRIGDHTKKTGVQIKEAVSQGSAPGRNRLRKVARTLARNLEAFGVFMVDANNRYEAAAGEAKNSLEFLMEFFGLAVKADPAGTREKLESELTVLNNLLDAARRGRQAFQSLYTSMTELPPLERQLNRAIASTAQEVRKMANNIGQTEAAVSRGIRVGERIQSELREELQESRQT